MWKVQSLGRPGGQPAGQRSVPGVSAGPHGALSGNVVRRLYWRWLVQPRRTLHKSRRTRTLTCLSLLVLVVVAVVILPSRAGRGLPGYEKVEVQVAAQSSAPVGTMQALVGRNTSRHRQTTRPSTVLR